MRVHAVLARRVAMNTTRLRERKKLSQHQLADLLGVTQPYLSMLESGKLNPSLLMIEKLAEAFHIHPESMFKECP